jgi:hypothetical protein
MSKSRIRQTEQIVLSAVAKKHRILGYLCPNNYSSATELSEGIAEGFARAGMTTLLVDLTGPVQHKNGKASSPTGESLVGGGIARDERGFDRWAVQPTTETRHRLNNVDGFRSVLIDDLRNYSKIVLNLPAAIQEDDDLVNPAGPAAACDAVYMVCANNGVSRGQLAKATHSLKSAGVQLTGLILDDPNHQALGEEIARSILWLLPFAPEFANRIATKVRANGFLN